LSVTLFSHFLVESSKNILHTPREEENAFMYTEKFLENTISGRCSLRDKLNKKVRGEKVDCIKSLSFSAKKNLKDEILMRLHTEQIRRGSVGVISRTSKSK